MSTRRISLVALLLAVLVAATGCSAGSDTSSASLQVAVAATYVSEEATTALEADLKAAFPALNTEEASMVISGISTGDSEKDPETTMAGMARMMGMMASGEIELLICDSDNARRYGDGGEAYVPISDLFTDDELAALGLTAVSVPLLDEEGNPTGEMSGACGIDLSSCTALTQSIYKTDIAAYVLVNTTNVENAKAVIKHLAAGK